MRGFLGWCRPTLSRLRHIIGVFSETALADSGMEDARKRPRSARRSIRSLWSRCRCLCNCLDPLRLERTLVWLASLFRHPARARINYYLRGLAAWVGLGSPACNPSIFWASHDPRRSALGQNPPHIREASPTGPRSVKALIVRVATAHAPAHSNPMARVGESSARPKNFDVRVARKSH